MKPPMIYPLHVLTITALMLLSTAAVCGQRHVIVQDKYEDVYDRNSNRGELFYAIVLEGGEKIGDNEFEFADIDDARIVVTFRLVAKNDRWAERMRVGISPQAFRQHTNTLWRPYATSSFLIGSGDGSKSVTFRFEKEGTSNLRLPFIFLDTEDDNLSDPTSWKIDIAHNLIITPVITVRKKKPGKVTPQDVQSDLESMIAYYSDQSNERLDREKVREMIISTVKDDFRRLVLQDASIPTSEAFVKKYEPYTGKGFTDIDNNVRLTKINIADLTAKDREDEVITHSPDPDRETERERQQREWRQLFYDRDSARLNAYLIANSARLPPEKLADARDSLICWSEASYEPLGEQEGRELIRLHNFVSPAYYDVYQDWIEIDDEKLRTEGLLSIVIYRSQKLKLIVADKGCPGKQVEIPLDNLMRAGLTVDSIRGLYHFTFQGGNKPYVLSLYLDSTAETGWSREGIASDKLTLQRDSLQAAGLRGSFRAAAYSAGSESPVTVAGGLLFIPRPPAPEWVLPVLVALAVGGVALLVLYILRRAKRGRSDIFSEA